MRTGAPAATRVTIAAPTTAVMSRASTVHARSVPSLTATESTPAAVSRSRSARAFAMASPVPATTATGSRTAKEGGRLPVAPSQPNTGSNGMPTANGTHDQAVPLKTRS